jgi:membrane protease YdiL (CAAX protease family)
VGLPPPTDLGYPDPSREQATPSLGTEALADRKLQSGVDLVDVVLIVLAAVCAIIFSLTVGTITIYLAQAPHALDARQLASNAFFVIPTQVAAYLMVVGFMAFIVWVRHGQTLPKAIQWNMPSERLFVAALGIGAVLGLCSEFASVLLQRWTPKSLPIDEYFRNPSAGYLLAGFGILVAPLVEELFFRGFVYPAVARWTGSVSSVVITAAAFAALHGGQLAYAWAPLLVLFGIGTALTIIRAKTGSVATCVVVHMGYNLALFIMLFVATGGFHHMERA